MSERAVHVVFGAGQIGVPLARTLVQQGHEVRMVRRSGGGPEGVTMFHGDAGDPAFAAHTSLGASAVYHCMNPEYSAAVWARELPRLAASLIAAAARSGARLVVLDNVYPFGRLANGVLDENAAFAPCSRKGEIRARVSEQLMAAHRAGTAHVVVGRGSDFYGPGGTQTYFGNAFWPKALAKGVAETLVELDSPHTYHYTLDVATALATLGSAPDDTTGRWWMMPCAPADSTRGMIERFARVLGRPLKVQPMAGWMLGLAKPFMPILSELSEMAYQWQAPFVMNDAQYRARFGATPTALEAGVPATVTWARSQYEKR